MQHSNKVREFIMSDKGIRLVDAYVGNDGVLVGSARIAHEARARRESGDSDRAGAVNKKGKKVKR
jgi:circadian clock protein KaiC